MIPLILKIRKETHKSIAVAQDIIIQELCQVFENSVLHGGTAIWRCYNGNRFSEDIDVYLPKDNEKIEILFKNLQKQGFEIEKKKISENSLYSDLVLNRVHVKLEGIFKKIKGHLKEYQTVENNLISVYTLTPEELIAEKTEAYLKRRKIRDLYDIFFLVRFVKNLPNIKPEIEKLKKEFNIPVDEKDLKTLILEGLIPTSQKMLEYLKNITWEK